MKQTKIHGLRALLSSLFAFCMHFYRIHNILCEGLKWEKAIDKIHYAHAKEREYCIHTKIRLKLIIDSCNFKVLLFFVDLRK